MGKLVNVQYTSVCKNYTFIIHKFVIINFIKFLYSLCPGPCWFFVPWSLLILCALVPVDSFHSSPVYSVYTYIHTYIHTYILGKRGTWGSGAKLQMKLETKTRVPEYAVLNFRLATYVNLLLGKIGIIL